MVDNNWERELGNAVIMQAVGDYRKALCRKKPDIHEIRSLESFFTGKMFTLYSSLDGRELMNRIKRDAMSVDYDYDKLNRMYGFGKYGVIRQ